MAWFDLIGAHFDLIIVFLDLIHHLYSFHSRLAAYYCKGFHRLENIHFAKIMTIKLIFYTFIMNSLTMCMDIDVKGFKFQQLGDNNSAAAFGLV